MVKLYRRDCVIVTHIQFLYFRGLITCFRQPTCQSRRRFSFVHHQEREEFVVMVLTKRKAGSGDEGSFCYSPSFSKFVLLKAKNKARVENNR